MDRNLEFLSIMMEFQLFLSIMTEFQKWYYCFDAVIHHFFISSKFYKTPNPQLVFILL